MSSRKSNVRKKESQHTTQRFESAAQIVASRNAAAIGTVFTS